MNKIKMKNEILMTKAFTLLESLLVLLIISFITTLFSLEIIQTVRLFKGELFVLQFEDFYKRSQEDAALLQKSESLVVKNHELNCEDRRITIPKEVEVKEFTVKFDDKGENSSLQKLTISLPYEKKLITYQLEIGSGKFKKKIS
ncbi:MULTISPECIES: competence type IV pilus minor pilin ComGD [Lactococcus]|uniref:competence type IV pilus minor pilin ComGD n=1 Tax=Lactococcus TaxID=1357 RepID=UPI001CDBEF50|nr:MULTISPECIES: competence type IV pilus minor pilin ComGD [Lactococcus]MCA2390415.1 competence protein [Lactococcus sp. NH2-7C]MCT1182143.1 competence protein [Lactococcus lactis]MCT1193568.1 competence protein [Lactococcus lactis]